MRCYEIQAQFVNHEWKYFTFKDYVSALHFFNECVKAVFPLSIALCDINGKVLKYAIFNYKTHKMETRRY